MTDERLTQYATDMGCEGADVLDCLRGKSVEDLIDLTPTDRTTGMMGGGPRIFGTVIDGTFLKEPARGLRE